MKTLSILTLLFGLLFSSTYTLAINDTETHTTGDPKPKSDHKSEDSSMDDINVVQINNAEALQTALLDAKPGDLIVLMPGTYTAPKEMKHRWQGAQRLFYFGGSRDGKPISGTEDKPIVLQSAYPERPAVLRGLDTKGLGYVLWINGEHWIIRNLIIENGGKGLMMDNASYSYVGDVTIRQTGDEGLHLRSGTSKVLIDNVTVEDTGLYQPGFGEGIYIGSDRAQWDKYAPRCNNNIIRNCTLRRTTAEAIDIKEGVTGTVVTGCSIYGSKISNKLFADSFIDIKGNGSRIFNNKFYKEGNRLVTRGIALVNRNNDEIKVSSSHNWIYNNEFNMNNKQGALVHGYKGVENYAWNNKRIPKNGEGYKSKNSVLQLRVPDKVLTDKTKKNDKE